MKNLKTKLLLSLLVVMTSIAGAQNISTPRPSQQSTITQRLGLSDVTIVYHSPGVKGRKVFGSIVTDGNIWRAGANENTTIQFTHDATIEGESIAAGTYGLFMIPGESEFQILFSKYNQSWGTNSPTENELALKVSVKTESIPFQEWLSYDFIDRGSKSLTAVLQWEKMRIPFKIKFDVDKVVIDNARAELKGVAGFSWRGYMQAANYCLQSDTNLEEAMTWIDRSITISKGFSNLQVKAGLLVKNGDVTGAEKIMQEAIPTGSPNQLNSYGYQLLARNKTTEAIKVFKLNVERNQNHQFIWGFTDSLAEAYLKKGDKVNALKYYKLAKTKAPQNQQAYLDGVIAGIK